MREVVLYGASGHSKAFKCSLSELGLAQVVAFIDDFRGDRGDRLDDKPVVSFETWRDTLRRYPCFITVGDAAAKRRLAERVAAAGGMFCNLYEPPRGAFPEVTVGAGSLIVPPIYVGPGTSVGNHVAIMPMSSFGHDVTIGDFCTICPSVSIGGHVVIASEVFIGAGATVINGRADKPLVVGRGATIAAGAVVTKSVSPGVVVMGNPARPLRELARTKRGRTPS